MRSVVRLGIKVQITDDIDGNDLSTQRRVKSQGRIRDKNLRLRGLTSHHAITCRQRREASRVILVWKIESPMPRCNDEGPTITTSSQVR